MPAAVPEHSDEGLLTDCCSEKYKRLCCRAVEVSASAENLRQTDILTIPHSFLLPAACCRSHLDKATINFALHKLILLCASRLQACLKAASIGHSAQEKALHLETHNSSCRMQLTQHRPQACAGARQSLRRPRQLPGKPAQPSACRQPSAQRHCSMHRSRHSGRVSKPAARTTHESMSCDSSVLPD